MLDTIAREVRAPNGELIGHITSRCGDGKALVVPVMREPLSPLPHSPIDTTFEMFRLEQVMFSDHGVKKWVFAPSGDQIPIVERLPYFSPFND